MSEGPARLRRISSAIRSEAFSRAEIADHLGGVAVLAVDRLVHRAHVVGGDFSGEGIEGGPDLRPALEGFVAHQRDGLVGREIVLVVFKRRKPEGLNGSIG